MELPRTPTACLDVGDGCPLDPDESIPGACGCSAPDVDADALAIAGCLDICPGFADNADIVEIGSHTFVIDVPKLLTIIA